jgi:hydroxymethylpyrimidine/phosphomethylpyrimidine kinase
MKGRVLIVAGSDSGGGAGIQADIKTVLALGAHAMTAVTALTAQDTLGVHGVHPTPPAFVRLQMEVVLADLGADAVKTGMLGDAATIETVADVLRGRGLALVLDPVMVAKGGARLLDPAALDALREQLLPLAALLTPNIPEAEALLGHPIPDHAAALEAAEALRALGAPAVLLKGGHLDGAVVRDVLATAEGVQVLTMPRIDTRHTHGTGCTLASGIAAGLAQGLALEAAVRRARAYVQAAIIAAPGFGLGHGPLDHGVTVDPVRIDRLG